MATKYQVHGKMFTAGKYLWGMERWSGLTEEYGMAHGEMANLTVSYRTKLSNLRYELTSVSLTLLKVRES